MEFTSRRLSAAPTVSAHLPRQRWPTRKSERSVPIWHRGRGGGRICRVSSLLLTLPSGLFFVPNPTLRIGCHIAMLAATVCELTLPPPPRERVRLPIDSALSPLTPPAAGRWACAAHLRRCEHPPIRWGDLSKAPKTGQCVVRLGLRYGRC